MTPSSLQKNAALNRRYRFLMRVAEWIAALPNKVIPAPFRVMQMGSLYWQSRALYVAANLGVADALGDGEKSTMELAKSVQADEDHLYRLLRMLASLGVFKETGHRCFENSALSDCIRTDHPDSVKSMVLMHNSPEMVAPWVQSLESSIKTGSVPFADCHGTELFHYMSENPRFDSLFSQAMDSVENLVGHAFLEDLDWSQFDHIIDVGGSRGSKSLSILKRYTDMSATVVDRPSIVADAEAHLSGQAEQSVLSRMRFEGGDILEALPRASNVRNVYLCIAVFHALSDDEALQLLSTIGRSMNGVPATVIIADAVADEVGVNSNVALFDMQMLVGCKGRERTLSEWQKLFDQAGFTLQERVSGRSFGEFLVLVK